MIVKQILLLFSTIILAVTGLPHDLNYKEKYYNLESHSSAPYFDQDKAKNVLKTLRSKEKPCTRRFNSDNSLDSDELIQTSSHVVVIPYESLDSNRLNPQKHYAPNKNNVQYFNDGDSYKAFLRSKSTENEQESEPVTGAGENIINYIRSPKKNKVSVIPSYEPQNLSQQESVDINEEAQPIQSPFRVFKSQQVSVEDAYDTLESLARLGSPGYDNEQREITAQYPPVNNYEKVNRTLSLLNHNQKNGHIPTKPINRGQNIDNSQSVQENDKNYDAITYALEMEMAEEDVRSGKNNQNEKYNPQVFKNIAKLLSIYEQNNEEQELPSKDILVVNPSRNTLKAQSLKKYDDTHEDTDSIQDDQNIVKNNLGNLRSKANIKQSPKAYEESYDDRNPVANYLKSQSFKHNNDNEESISQESNLTKESDESEIDPRLVKNNLRDSHSKNKFESVKNSQKDYFNNQKARKDTHKPNSSQSYITLQTQLHHNSNSESVKAYEDTNSERRSGDDSNYFSESEQDSLGVSDELKKSQLSDKNSNLNSFKPNNGFIVKVSPLIKHKKQLFSPELSRDQNFSDEVDENSSSPRGSNRQDYHTDDLSESFENKAQNSNSRHHINSPVSKVTASLKARKLLLNDDNIETSDQEEEDSPEYKVIALPKGKKILFNDDNINQSSSQEGEDSPQYRSSHKSHEEDNKSNSSNYRENEANDRYKYIVQVPEIRVKKGKHLVNDQVSNHKSSNQNLIDQNLTQEEEENIENYHSSSRGSHRQDYDIDVLSESFENKDQKSRYQISSPVSKVTASLKGRNLILNDDNINQSSSQEEENYPNYLSSSHKSHDKENKSNFSGYQENGDKRINGHYQNKFQVPEVEVKEHLVNHKVSDDELLNQEAELNIDVTNENSSQKEQKRLVYPISHHKSQPKNNDSSQSDNFLESLESKNNIFNSRNQNSQIIASVNDYQKLKKDLEGKLLYRSNVPNNHDIKNYNSNLDSSKTQEYVEKILDGRYKSTGSLPEIIVKDKKHLVNDELSSDQLSSQETEEIETGQQDSQVTAVVKNRNLKSRYEAKESQYHSTLPDVLSPNYNNHLKTSEIQKSDGKSSDDGYKPKASQKIQEIPKDTISFNNINEEGGTGENINDDYVVNISADNLNNGDSDVYSANDNSPNVDISFDNSGLRNGYLNNIKDSTCRDKLDLSADYAQSKEALPNDEVEQNIEIELRTGNNEQLDEDESQNDGSGCIKDKIKLSKNKILNSSSRRFLNNYLEEEHQDREDEEEKADKEDETEETEVSDEIVERDVEGSEPQNSEPQNSLFDPSIGKGVREFSESRMLLSESSRLVCYACSTLSDPTCWAPDGKTTVKYCQKGHDSCIQRTYEGKDALILVRDCAVSCEGETVPGLSLKYKTCEVCHSDLCNSAYTALNSLNLMVMLGVITFVKYVF